MNNPQKQLYQTAEIETSKGIIYAQFSTPYNILTSAEAVQINRSALQTPNFAALSRDSTRTMYGMPVYTASNSTPPIMQIQTLPNFPGSPQRGPVNYTFQSIPGLSYDNSPVRSTIPVSYATPAVAVPFNVQCSCPKPPEPMEVDEQRDDKELLDISTSMGNFTVHQNIVCGVCTQTSVDACTSTGDLWAQSLRYSSPNLSRSSLPVIQEETSMDCSTSTTDLPPSDDDDNDDDDDDDDDDDSPQPLYLKKEAAPRDAGSRSCILQCQLNSAEKNTKGTATSSMSKLPKAKDSEEIKHNDSSAKREDIPRGTVTLGTSTSTLEGSPSSEADAALAKSIVSSVVRRGFPSTVNTATSTSFPPSEHSASSNLSNKTVKKPQGESSGLARDIVSSAVRRSVPSETVAASTSTLEKPSNNPSSETANKDHPSDGKIAALAKNILSSAVRKGFPSTPAVGTPTSGKSAIHKPSSEAVNKPQPPEDKSAKLLKDNTAPDKNEDIPRRSTIATSTSSITISNPSSKTVSKSQTDTKSNGKDNAK